MLHNLEIKSKIDANNKLIEELLNPNAYTLNNTVADLLEENRQLQLQCKHEYEDGYCIFCYSEEKK